MQKMEEGQDMGQERLIQGKLQEARGIIDDLARTLPAALSLMSDRVMTQDVVLGIVRTAQEKTQKLFEDIKNEISN